MYCAWPMAACELGWHNAEGDPAIPTAESIYVARGHTVAGT